MAKTTEKKTKKNNILQMPQTKAEMAAELQSLQRARAVILKSRNMQSNRLQAVVAGTLGYSSSMPEKERMKKFVEATAVIKGVLDGKLKHPMESVIRTTMYGVTAFNDLKDDLESKMKAFAKKLPVADWVEQKEQRGFGLLFLAIVIGETGDLDLYANPGKVWKRMGCAPYTFDGKTLMGATWRGGKEGKLPASEWETFGYSPRRRSISFLIGEGLMKQNFTSTKTEVEAVIEEGENSEEVKPEILRTVTWLGPYRNRYQTARVRFKEGHPEYSDLRCHRHGMLVATKMLLKNLWAQWTGKVDEPKWDGATMKRAEDTVN